MGEEVDKEELWQALEKAAPASGSNAAVQQQQKTHSTFGQQAGAKGLGGAWVASSDADLATAPFRFTELNTQVALVQKAQARNNPSGTFSAVLKVDWAVETPLMIGDGETTGAQSYRLGNRWAIPGSTIRGLLRSVIETVSFARMQQINRHRRFALRDFDHKDYQAFIATPIDKIGAGWLTKNAEGMPVITPCDWGFVEIGKVPKNSIRPRKKKDGTLIPVAWKEGKRGEKYEALGEIWKGKDALRKTRRFSGPLTDIYGKQIYDLGPEGREGVLVCTGPVTGPDAKRIYEYVFFDRAGSKAVELDEGTWQEFVLNNSKPSANKPKPDGAWAELAPTYEAEGRVPVFFVGNLAGHWTDPDFSFGLTRLYRKPHKLSVGDVLRQQQPTLATLDAHGKPVHQMDFAEHLFGFVHEWKDLTEGLNVAMDPDFVPPDAISRRGRIAVGFALADKDGFRAWPDQPIEVVMGAPKPSYAPFYLSGPEKDWSNPKSRLAGRKQYLVRHDGKEDAQKALKTALVATKSEQNSADQTSKVSFVVPASEQARFRGDIRLTNVSQAEIGAVLWALGFGGDEKARHLMGRAKPFGAGQVRADHVALHIRDNPNPIRWTPQLGPGPVADYLTAFAADIAGRVGLAGAQAWAESPQVTDLLAVARPHGFNAALGDYLQFKHPVHDTPRFAGAFMRLKKKTGLNSRGAPDTLLPAGKRP
jgi:CRISPR-associated protein (TIGR03986 family)